MGSRSTWWPPSNAQGGDGFAVGCEVKLAGLMRSRDMNGVHGRSPRAVGGRATPLGDVEIGEEVSEHQARDYEKARRFDCNGQEDSSRFNPAAVRSQREEPNRAMASPQPRPHCGRAMVRGVGARRQELLLQPLLYCQPLYRLALHGAVMGGNDVADLLVHPADPRALDQMGVQLFPQAWLYRHAHHHEIPEAS